ncbi:hypothetical protein J3458_005818 [Metarhizium acridum]|uniref:uncharacterized protein n=1 Tax=Metarhizium acridum TaxID=92637 RepID=UPI001C6C127D|nr:hypothetical protein J3458_005818 [Metarhizium acridum]
MSTSPRLTYNITEVSPLKEIPDRKETSISVQRPFSVLNDIFRRIPVVGSTLDSALQPLENVIFPGNAPVTKRGINYAALNEKKSQLGKAAMSPYLQMSATTPSPRPWGTWWASTSTLPRAPSHR